MRYHFFLILHLPRFRTAHKKNSNIFKEMEAFIRSKNAEQCRSHHQKRTQAKDILEILKTFYHHYYEIRFLDGEHCRMELAHYLTKVNPHFLTTANERSGARTDLPSLLFDFERNLQEILFVPKKDQNTQTHWLEEPEAEPTA
jgi:hypothetical protein